MTGAAAAGVVLEGRDVARAAGAWRGRVLGAAAGSSVVVPPELNGYRTVSQIGIGARSTINHVVRVTTGQSFALKRIVRRTAEDARYIRQAEIEYRVAGSVNHPSLRKCHELHETRRWFRVVELLLLMEYVPGKPLESAPRGELGEIVSLFRSVAAGLDALHNQGFVHADIKPNNILLTESGQPKIIDFGQSCRIGHKKSTIQGTPDYIAPEQVRRLPLDRRTDLFNLGATLYWALTGKTFPTDLRLAAKPGGHEIPGPKRSPKDLVPSLPAALSQLVMDCCESSPEKRPAHMKQFISRLDVAEQLWRKGTTERASGEAPVTASPS